MIRTFIAVELPEPLRRSLARVQEELRVALPMPSQPRQDVRHDSEVRLQWVRPQSLHVTLKFLGDIEEAHVQRLQAALSEAVHRVAPFSVEVGGIGAFPDSRAPRVIWAGLRAGTPDHPLIQLAAMVDRALLPMGFPIEAKPFSPHLTLARVKGGSRALGKVLYGSLQNTPRETGVLGTLPVDAIGLIKSELRPTGSVYTPLFHVPLAGDTHR